MGPSFEAPRPAENLESSISKETDLGFEELGDSLEKKDEVPDAGNIPVIVQPIPTPAVSEYEKRQKQIEDFLSQGLEDAYLAMPSEKRAEFRRVGEDTAAKINELLEKTKVNIGKIVLLIRRWLAMLPGVNKLFLEQEAKIRADEVIKLKRLN